MPETKAAFDVLSLVTLLSQLAALFFMVKTGNLMRKRLKQAEEEGQRAAFALKLFMQEANTFRAAHGLPPISDPPELRN